MEIMEEEYTLYWETQRFFENAELNTRHQYDAIHEMDEVQWSCIFGPESGASAERSGSDEAIPSESYDLSSPKETTSSAFSSANIPKTVLIDRKRRRMMNDKLYALRSVVPNITKMNKASIINDAIEYIQVLQEQEKKIISEISELEKIPISDVVDNGEVLNESRKKRAKSSLLAPGSPGMPSNIELKISQVGKRGLGVTISCSKEKDNMIKVCEFLESLNIKIVTANITSTAKFFLQTVYVESDEMNISQLKEMMESAIAELNSTERRYLSNHYGVGSKTIKKV